MLLLGVFVASVLVVGEECLRNKELEWFSEEGLARGEWEALRFCRVRLVVGVGFGFE